jgi:hypothetical protein
MKYFLLFLLAVFGCRFISGQSVTFQYDKSGNRISRTSTITLKSTSSPEEKSESEDVLSDEVGDYSIMIYPNPVSIELTVVIQNLDESTEASIAVFDQGGRCVLNLANATGNNLLSLSHLTPGNYYMVIKVGSENTRWKIVKE